MTEPQENEEDPKAPQDAAQGQHFDDDVTEALSQTTLADALACVVRCQGKRAVRQALAQERAPNREAWNPDAVEPGPFTKAVITRVLRDWKEPEAAAPAPG